MFEFGIILCRMLLIVTATANGESSNSTGRHFVWWRHTSPLVHQAHLKTRRDGHLECISPRTCYMKYSIFYEVCVGYTTCQRSQPTVFFQYY